MSKFTSSDQIGRIVAAFPKAGDLFQTMKIDFCCGGHRPLIEAIREQGLDEADVLTQLNLLYDKTANGVNLRTVDWQKADLNDLVEHIVNKHHAYLWSELPVISERTTLILRVHGANHPELAKVHKLFHMVKMELEAHLTKEETIQYPAIRKYLQTREDRDLDEAIRVIRELEEEHEGAGNILKELQEITKDYTVPDDGCETYQATYQKLHELQSDVFQHIHLENNILFPRLMRLQKA